ncbi:Putative uncharacterized protein [Moritella viscosa]|uniref:helix-turn-helix domain-containing protein n=1 Tax=Moritella viscosa TaxID=80854 RepID=UPI000910D18D|nr:helix-turn-helix domain-containing protein [Moritella viscosa]SGZ07592.1 Putative uncharacterized protein [Moritella viscosa]
MGFGAKFKKIRKKHKYTQVDFAKELDIPFGSYQKYELEQYEVSSVSLVRIVDKFPEYTLWLMTGETAVAVGQISPSDEKPKMEGAAVPAELLNAAFEQTLMTSIELGWITPKEGVNFSMLSDLLRHDFVQQGGRLIEPASDNSAKTEVC